MEHYREAVRVGKANHGSGSSDEAATLLKPPIGELRR
jgi:hypothetical protein